MNISGNRILITGADGFIGSHLAEMLAARGAKVRALSLYNSFGSSGWLDEADPKLDQLIRGTLDRESAARGLAYHELRYRNSGTSVWVEVHLLFPSGVPLEGAHAAATAIGEALEDALPVASRVISEQ